jgi:anti-sigma B factor antagonist
VPAHPERRGIDLVEASMSVEISVAEQGSVTVVAVRGDLDMGTAPQLLDAGVTAIDAGRTQLVVDLSGVTFCDSSGLGAFVRLKKRIDAAHGCFALAGPNPTVRTILDVTGLTEVVGVHTSVGEAAAAVSR